MTDTTKPAAPAAAPAAPAPAPTLAEQQAAAEKAAQVTTVDEATKNEVKLPKVGAKVSVRPVHGPMLDVTTNKEIPQTEDGVNITVTAWVLMQIAAKKIVVLN